MAGRLLRISFFLAWLLLLLPCALTFDAQGQDMRADYVKLLQKKEELAKRAAEEEQKAVKEAKAARLRILQDKKTLDDAIAERKAENDKLKKRIEGLKKSIAELEKRGEELRIGLDRVGGPVRNVASLVASYASDLETLVNSSPQTAMDRERGSFLKQLSRPGGFPSMEDIAGMADLLLDEAARSGEVRIEKGTVVDASGVETPADLLLVGNLTTLYRTRSDIGYALYSRAGRRFFALSKNPPFWVDFTNKRFFTGRSDSLYLDLSDGTALRRMADKPGIIGQISAGGPVVWPIIALFVVGLCITAERFLFLKKRMCDTESFMERVGEMVRAGEWESCKAMCESEFPKSVPRIIATALEFRGMSREDMENALQESILNEIPRLERFLSTLGLLAAIAPLLGLLGTVTGMIHTFQAITHYGTADPRMMSAGISEALVTTMLGLCAAIPLMFGHTLLGRRVDTIISEMEEKAVSFVNLVFKSRKAV